MFSFFHLFFSSAQAELPPSHTSPGVSPHKPPRLSFCLANLPLCTRLLLDLSAVPQAFSIYHLTPTSSALLYSQVLHSFLCFQLYFTLFSNKNLRINEITFTLIDPPPPLLVSRHTRPWPVYTFIVTSSPTHLLTLSDLSTSLSPCILPRRLPSQWKWMFFHFSRHRCVLAAKLKFEERSERSQTRKVFN